MIERPGPITRTDQAIEVQVLLKQIEELKAGAEQKDRKIISLQNRMGEMAEENRKLKQELRNKDVLIKNYNHNLHNKNVSLNNLEAKFQADMEGLISKKNSEIDELKLIISSQAEEIRLLMGDQEMMVSTFEEVHRIEQIKSQERSLLKEFNTQLQAQIEQLENQNQVMITELEETRKELDLQNTQGEDLMSQLEVIGDHIGIAVSQ